MRWPVEGHGLDPGSTATTRSAVSSHRRWDAVTFFEDIRRSGEADPSDELHDVCGGCCGGGVSCWAIVVLHALGMLVVRSCDVVLLLLEASLA